MTNDDDWKETKKEFSVDDNGKQKLLRVVKEVDTSETLTKKDRLAFLFQITGICSIVVSILLFYFQKKSDNESKRQEFIGETYINASTCFHAILDGHLNRLNAE